MPAITTVNAVTWWDNVQQVTGGATLGSIARRVGLSEGSISRWKSGTPKPENVVLFCRAYGIPVIDGFVMAGWLTDADAKITPAARANSADLSDDELIAEVTKRIRRSAPPEGPVAWSDRLTRQQRGTGQGSPRTGRRGGSIK